MLMVSSDTFTFSLSPSEQNHSLCMCDDYGRMCGRIHISFPILNCCLVWLEGCTSGRFEEMLILLQLCTYTLSLVYAPT